jgi:lantibiotic biosynthesis protein
VTARGRPAHVVELDEHVVVRCPTLPVEAYPTNGTSSHGRPEWDQRAAVAIGASTQSLAQAPESSESAAGARLRYRIRMATRPTPRGLFAGVGLARWSDQTQLRLAGGFGQTCTRPPFEWLIQLAREAEDDPEILDQLQVRANPGVELSGARLRLPEGIGPRAPGGLRTSSIKATRAARTMLRLAERPVAAAHLRQQVAASSGADPNEVQRLLHSLVRIGLLMTELSPTLTGDSPAHALLTRLRTCVPETAVTRRLERALCTANQLDAAYASGASVPGSEPPTWHIDAALELVDATLGPAVADEATRAAELLLALSTQPEGRESLRGYRQSFEHRYGLMRDVPLLELLDPSAGLGYPAGYPNSLLTATAPNLQQHLRRGEVLTRLAYVAFARRELAVELTHDLLSDLRLTDTPQHIPETFEVFFLVAAPNASDIDSGNFRLIIGPNIGAMESGRNLGRFASVASGAQHALSQAAASHAGQHGRLCAELVYLPTEPKLGNVSIRLHPYTWEVPVGCRAGVSEEHVIPFNELHVRVVDGALRLYWPRAAAEVCLHATHMLNPQLAPPVCRFLSEFTGWPEATQLGGFNWQSAASLPFLPRVQAGRCVLSPATWQVVPRDLAPDQRAGSVDRLSAFRATWNLPARVYLSHGDQRLLLDLDDADHCELLRHAVAVAGQTRVTLQEALPDLDDAWVVGPDGHYLVEVVASFRARTPTASAPTPTRKQYSIDRAERLRPPGSDWLQVNMYLPVERMDEALYGPIADLMRDATRSPSAWMFFVRYGDPAPHLRLRWRIGSPDRFATAVTALAPWTSALVQAGIATRWTIETYEREIERYGGLDSIDDAEAVFCLDSTAALAILRAINRGDLPEVVATALSMDRLLCDLGWSAEQRAGLYADIVGERRYVGGDLFRSFGRLLRQLLAASPPDPAWQPIVAALEARRDAIRESLPLGSVLRQMERTAGPHGVAASVCHMTVNRLAAYQGEQERAIYDLLRRVHHSLAKYA